MKTGMIVNAQPVLNQLAEAKLPMGIAFKLLKALKEVGSVMEVYEERRKEIFEKYGEPQGDQIVVKPENQDAFTNDMNTLFNEDVEVNLPSLQLSDIESVEMSVAELATIEWLLSDEEKAGE